MRRRKADPAWQPLLIEQILSSFCAQYEVWYRSPARNGWIEDAALGLKVYLRKNTRTLPTGIATTLDIGSIEISPVFQCQGIGMALLHYLHCNHSFDATYIENILTRRLLRGLKREGWIVVDPTDYSPCVYKLRNPRTLVRY